MMNFDCQAEVLQISHDNTCSLADTLDDTIQQ